MSTARNQFERLQKAMSIGMRPEEMTELQGIEKRIKSLEDYAALAGRPGLKEFIEWCKTEIRSVNDRLSTDIILLKDGREGERFAMINRKEILLYFIGLFDPYAELDFLEKDLSDRAQSFEEYHNNH